MVGNSNSIAEASRRQPELRILVDGKPLFQHVFKSHADVAQLDVPIGDLDDFLTIVGIASAPTYTFQDIILGDPFFQMSPGN